MTTFEDLINSGNYFTGTAKAKIPHSRDVKSLFPESITRTFKIWTLCECFWEAWCDLTSFPIRHNCLTEFGVLNGRQMEILTNSKARQKKTGVGCEACKGNLWFYDEIDESTLIGWKIIGPEIFREKCQECSGKGFIKETSKISCENCSGKGWVLSESKNDAEICSDCQGNKRVSEHKKSPCHHCDGLGFFARVLQREEYVSNCGGCRGLGNLYFDVFSQFQETCDVCYGTGQIEETMKTFNFTVNRWKASQWRLLPEMQFNKNGEFRCDLDSDYLCEKIENSGFPLIPEHRSDSKYEFVGDVYKCNCRRNPLCETCEGAGVYIHISVFGECLECEGSGVESIVCLDCKGMGKHVLCRYSEIV